MRMTDILERTRDGGELSDEELAFFVKAYVRGDIPDYQASALLMAICIHGMSDRETLALTLAMAKSGDTLDLKDIPGVKRDDTTMEVVLDENVTSKEDVRALGIEVGDFISLDPRAVRTPSGYIKSRHLDDKASASVLLALAKMAAAGDLTLSRRIYLVFTVHEEIGHGCCAGLPEDAEDILSVDMGCVGDDLGCDETMVSICAKDSRGPYNYEMTGRLIELAKDNSLNYAVDVYPMYASDADASLFAGHNFRHALIGPGVFASHGYERTHISGLDNTLRLLAAFVAD